MSRNGDVLYIVMPAYNEGETIRDVVKAWIKVLDGKSRKSRLVVADSGSTDNTHEILVELKKRYKNLEILDKTNKLHGPKVIALYKYAIKMGADYIFQTDSDGQTDPREFNGFWVDRNERDGILGYRCDRGDGKIRAMVEKVVCLLLCLFFDVRVPDANAPFRLMRTNLVAKYIDKIPEDYDLPNIILTAFFVRFGENVEFKKVSFRSRTAGVNSIDLKKIFKIGKGSLLTFYKFRKEMIKMDSGMARRIFLRKCGTFMIVLLFAIMAFFAVSTSPSFPWNQGETTTDSSVFLTIGTQMKNGLVPYLDTFDHKGPVLYIINYFGVTIDEISGILVFEFFALFVSLIFMYKIARLKIRSRGVSAFLVFIIFSLYLNFNIVDRGNLTEEYAMPLIAISLFVFLKYLMNKKISVFSIFVVGVCFALVALLRLNMVAIWPVFLVVILVKLIAEKRFNELVKLVAAFVLGIFVVVMPIMIWLFAEGALEAFISDYLVFNVSYSKTSFANFYATVVYFLEQALLSLSLAVVGYFAFMEKKNNRLLLVTFICAFLVAIFAVCMSGRNYPHYGMVLVPLPVFAFAWLYGEMENDVENERRLLSVVFSVFLLSLAFPMWLKVSQSTVASFSNRYDGEVVSNFVKKSCEYIDALTDRNDKIAVYGNRNYIYLKCGRLPASKYSYQFPIARVKPVILDEFFADMTVNKPKVFIIQEGYVDERVEKYLNENGYREEWREGEDDWRARVYAFAE